MAEYIATDGPKYWLAYMDTNIQVGNYGYLLQGFVINTEQSNLETFDTEEQLAARIDELKGTTDWYWEHRIPSPPRP